MQYNWSRFHSDGAVLGGVGQGQGPSQFVDESERRRRRHPIADHRRAGDQFRRQGSAGLIFVYILRAEECWW